MLAERYLADVFRDNEPLATALLPYRQADVFVTGATGIVGLAICRVLQRCGARVAAHARQPYDAGARWLGDGVRWLHGPLAEHARTRIGGDFVIHCATFGQPEKFSREWRETVSLNVDLLFQLLANTSRLGFASTTEIYSGLAHSAREDEVGTTSPQHPRAGYIESKRVGEAICAASGNAVANRIALASGPFPKANDSRAIYQIIRRARREGFVELQGGGSNVRQYQYSLACALRFLVTTAQGREPVYNNAGPYQLSMDELAAAIARRLAIPYRRSADASGIAGAPSIVSVDTSRFAREFPQFTRLDPDFDFFIDGVIEAADVSE